jgi:acyl-CoA synthetase (NDP forming)
VDTGRYALVVDEEEAFVAADKLGYPVVLKVVSPHVVHKSDVGGVKLGLHSPAALAEGLAEIRRRIATEAPQARLDGFLLAPQARPGSEVIIGGLRDRQMGPVVMFGLGGVLVEVYCDVVFRTAPVNRKVARGMIESVRGYPLLCGYRGSAEVDLEAIADVIVKLSRIISTQKDVAELELNPVRVYPDGLSILDARVVVA